MKPKPTLDDPCDYKALLKFVEQLYEHYGLPAWYELYQLTQPQPQPEPAGRKLMSDFKCKYNISPDNCIPMKNLF